MYKLLTCHQKLDNAHSTEINMMYGGWLQHLQQKCCTIPLFTFHVPHLKCFALNIHLHVICSGHRNCGFYAYIIHFINTTERTYMPCFLLFQIL